MLVTIFWKQQGGSPLENVRRIRIGVMATFMFLQALGKEGKHDLYLNFLKLVDLRKKFIAIYIYNINRISFYSIIPVSLVWFV